MFEPLLAADQLYKKAITDCIEDEDLDLIVNWPLEEMASLFACADRLRRYYKKQKVSPCTLMNIKAGGCSEDCAFCSQSAHNHAQVNIRDLSSPEEIFARYEYAAAQNLPLCVVSSGRRLSKKEIGELSETLKTCPGEKHASLGILDLDELKNLRDAGVVCYNHNIETSKEYFNKIVSTHTFEDRISTVELAKKAGLHVCCGGIFGMGESWEDRKSMCKQLKALKVDTIPLNFLNAIPGTRLSKPVETPMEFLKIVSLFRIAIPQASIKVCGGREVNLGALQCLIFFAGADGYVSGGYLTTGGAGVDADTQMINSLGLSS